MNNCDNPVMVPSSVSGLVAGSGTPAGSAAPVLTQLLEQAGDGSYLLGFESGEIVGLRGVLGQIEEFMEFGLRAESTTFLDGHRCS